MSRNPFRLDRLIRIQELLNFIQKEGELELDLILGWGGLRWGNREETIMAMLKQLEKARLIEIDNENHKVRAIRVEKKKGDEK